MPAPSQPPVLARSRMHTDASVIATQTDFGVTSLPPGSSQLLFCLKYYALVMVRLMDLGTRTRSMTRFTRRPWVRCLHMEVLICHDISGSFITQDLRTPGVKMSHLQEGDKGREYINTRSTSIWGIYKVWCRWGETDLKPGKNYLLWTTDKGRARGNTYMWGSVKWKTKI